VEIWAVCKDPGGTNGILPVVRILRSFGYEVLLIANGKAVELLKDGKEAYVVYDSAEKLLREYRSPDILVTSMCSYGGVGRDLVPLLRGKCSTVALQDFWGASLVDHGESAWGDVKYRPDYLVVNDEIGKKIVLETWPDYKNNQVLVLGYPALDKYASVNVREVSQKVRFVLGLEAKKPLVLFGGQGTLTKETLSSLVSALNIIGGDFYFIPRPHPRTKDNYPEEMTLWQKALAELKAGTAIFDFFGQTDMPSLLAASDLVISTYSTILVESAMLRKPNISILYESVMQDLRRNSGLKEFPLVQLGCSAMAETFESLQELLKKGLSGNLELEAAQKQNFRLDGKNAERVARFIVGLK